jgi:hypothetical protein
MPLLRLRWQSKSNTIPGQEFVSLIAGLCIGNSRITVCGQDGSDHENLDLPEIVSAIQNRTASEMKIVLHSKTEIGKLSLTLSIKDASEAAQLIEIIVPGVAVLPGLLNSLQGRPMGYHPLQTAPDYSSQPRRLCLPLAENAFHPWVFHNLVSLAAKLPKFERADLAEDASGVVNQKPIASWHKNRNDVPAGL